MNEPEPFSPRFLKTLFAKLVREVGRQDAAAAILGISRQRVGQLCDTRNPEQAKEVPTFPHIWALEQELGRSVVFQGLADAIDPAPVPQSACPVKETHDVVQAAAAMLPLADALKARAPGALEAFAVGLAHLQRQAAEADAAANFVPMRGH